MNEKRVDLTKTGKYFHLPRPASKVQEEAGKIDPMVVDYLDEFIEKLIEQLTADAIRWGNTWLIRPKEGQERRTKIRFTDYFAMFENAGTPVPWMKIVGGALICWIRDNHPELCIDANECEDVGKPGVMKAIEECGPNWGQPDNYHADEAEKAVEHRSAENFGNKELKRPLVGLGVKREEKALSECSGDVGTLDGDREVCKELCTDKTRNECRKEHIGGEVEAEKAVEDMTVKGMMENSPRPNPVAHVEGEKIENLGEGYLAYSSRDSRDGKVILDSVVFVLGKKSSGLKDAVLIGVCEENGNGNIVPVSEKLGVTGGVAVNGHYFFNSIVGVNLVTDVIYVSYDYEYKLPKD